MGYLVTILGVLGSIAANFAALRYFMKPLEAQMASLRAEFKGDIVGLRTEAKGDVVGLKGEIASLRGEVKSEIASLRGEVKSEIASLRGEVKSEIAELRDEIRALDAKYDQKTDQIRADILALARDINRSTTVRYRGSRAAA